MKNTNKQYRKDVRRRRRTLLVVFRKTLMKNYDDSCVESTRRDFFCHGGLETKLIK